MTDLELLELNADYSYEDLKKAFRFKSKKLHPDYNESSIESHIAMIELNRAYSNLLKILKTPSTISKEAIDDAYEIYKKAIAIFQTIHPSQWKRVNKEGMFNPGAIETSEETPKIIKSMIDDMAIAYHDFSIVVNEHPNSLWASDSRSKMKEIEKMTQRYMKILKSYVGVKL